MLLQIRAFSAMSSNVATHMASDRRGSFMPAKTFWSAVNELRDAFRGGGATHQARIDLLLASIRSAPPAAQRQMIQALCDVADSTNHLRCLLLAMLPPELTERTSGDQGTSVG
jgi:hypothetical protein